LRMLLATLACAEGIEHPYGVALSYEGEIVDEFFEKPIALLPSAIGLCIIEPNVYSVIVEKVDMNDEEAVEFESAVLTFLAKNKKLGRLLVKFGDWVSINTQKDLEIAERIFQEKK
jgi:NDP-sugar pyrophosphorylase family protein